MKPNASTQTGIQVRNLSPRKSTPLDCLLVTFATTALMLSGVDGSAISKANATEADTANIIHRTSLPAETNPSLKAFESRLNTTSSPEPHNSVTSATPEANPTQSDATVPSSSEVVPDDLMTVVRILMALF